MKTEQLVEILCLHNQRYPRWQPQDSIKLLHQAEFGGGHLLANPAQNLHYLKEEWAQQPRDPSHLFMEAIGNDFYRVYLPAYKGRGGSPERLQEAFYQSSFLSVGNQESLQQNLDELLRCAKQGCFAYPWDQLEKELLAYREKGYPMIRHSQIYRNHYQPSYRVIHRRYLDL